VAGQVSTAIANIDLNNSATTIILNLPDISATTWRVAQFGLTGVLIVMLWFAIDGRQVIRLLFAAQPIWLLAAVVTLICQTVLSATRWKITADVLGQSLPMRYAVKEYFMSQVVNQAVPGAVMGDAARAVRARKQVGLAVSGQAVLFERLAGQIAMFLTMAFGFFVTWSIKGGLDWPVAYAAPLALTIVVGLLLLVVSLCTCWYPASISQKLVRLVRPLQVALLSKSVLPAQIGLGVGITVCNLMAFGFCGWAVGVSLSLAALVAVVPVILFSMLIPFTVSGWGAREGAAAMLLPLAGITASEGVAISVMFGCALILAVLPGVLAVASK
jgi:uncharacterized membrane protein YbhN (UPF0104 family)